MNLDPIQRLTRDLKEAATTLSDNEARFLVDAYYQMQENRKRSDNQTRTVAEVGEPHAVLSWLADQSGSLERQVARALDAYSNAKPVGQWARSVVGVGPIIAAGLLAHIDIEKAPTVGHIWRFAGLDPTSKWEKGKKRPWNAALKVLCWKIGESFVKVSGNPEAVYGQIYVQRKEYERGKNEREEYRAQAEAVILSRPTHAQKETYAAGKLPDGHIHARAKRYAVKLFLSHYHEIAYVAHFGKKPPLPYPISILGHAHKIEPRASRVPANGE